MNVLVDSTECSSGCESGWTLYLEHSTSDNNIGYRKASFSKNQKSKAFEDVKHPKNVFFDENDEVEEEDLSMVSDASSGPPHFDHDIDEEDEEQDEDLWYNDIARSNKRSKKSSLIPTHDQCFREGDDFALDDTASSSFFPCNKKFAGTHLENRGSSLDSLVDYSLQGFSATHFQDGSYNLDQYGCVQSFYSTQRFHQPNQL